jgi:two-component system, LytTR family, response regulator
MIMENSKIIIPVVNGFEFLDAGEILYFKASGKHCKVVRLEKEELDLRLSLLEVEKLLETDHCFFRVHRSAIINLKHLMQFRNSKENVVKIRNGDEFAIAPEKRKELFSQFGITYYTGEKKKCKSDVMQ